MQSTNMAFHLLSPGGKCLRNMCGKLVPMSLVESVCSKFATYNCTFDINQPCLARSSETGLYFHWSPRLNKQIKECYEDNGWGNIWQLHVLFLKEKTNKYLSYCNIFISIVLWSADAGNVWEGWHGYAELRPRFCSHSSVWVFKERVWGTTGEILKRPSFNWSLKHRRESWVMWLKWDQTNILSIFFLIWFR